MLAFGRREARVLHTPGHTPGSVCFFVESAAARRRSCSRATRCSSDRSAGPICGAARSRSIEASIRERLFSLPDDTLVVPGHGPETTVGVEREENPFVRHAARGDRSERR